MDGKLDDRRRDLIAALRSGDYIKARSALFQVRDYEASDVFWWDRSYCCIGVGCSVRQFYGIVHAELNPEDHVDSEGRWDNGSGYDFFQNEYDVSTELLNRLQNMNDGSGRVVGVKDPRSWISFQRDFNFIARYLEVIWQLS
jgi:hypothetical protein